MSRSQSLLENELCPGPQMDVEIWHFHYGDDSGHKVSLRHSLVSNKYVLIVDGALIEHGSFPIMQRSFQIAWPLKDKNGSANAIITCQGNKGVTMTVKRVLTVDGVDIASLQSLLLPRPGPGEARAMNPNVGQFAPRRVGITDFHTIEEDEKKAIVYQLFVEPFYRDGQPKTVLVVERRYSEFVNLDSTLRSLRGVRGGSGYPVEMERELQLPPKVYNPLVNQVSTEFAEMRMKLLSKYLCKVVESIDSLMHVQEIYTFLGLSPLTGLPVDVDYKPGGGLNTPTPSKLPSLIPTA